MGGYPNLAKVEAKQSLALTFGYPTFARLIEIGEYRTLTPLEQLFVFYIMSGSDAIGFFGATFLYYLLIYLRSDVRYLVQGDFGIAYLIASHFFEHVLDFVYIYLFVALLVFSGV